MSDMNSAGAERRGRSSGRGQTQVLAAVVAVAGVAGLFLSVETLISGPAGNEASQDRIAAIAGVAFGIVAIALAGFLILQSERQQPSLADALLHARQWRHE